MKSFVNAKKLLGLVVVVLTGLWLINVSVHANPNDPGLPGAPAGTEITIDHECKVKSCGGGVVTFENECLAPINACGTHTCLICDGNVIIQVCWFKKDKQCHTQTKIEAGNFEQCGNKRKVFCKIQADFACGCPSVAQIEDEELGKCTLKRCTPHGSSPGGPQLPRGV
jgi:hypothetical protein